MFLQALVLLIVLNFVFCAKTNIVDLIYLNPNLQFVFACISHNMSPSFNPLIACGINQYSIPGAGIFYPFNYLLCFMNPVLAIEILKCLHLILVFITSYYLFKLITKSKNIALLAASIYVFTFYPIITQTSLTTIESLFWIICLMILKYKLTHPDSHKHLLFWLFAICITFGILCGLPLQFRLLILLIVLYPVRNWKLTKKENFYFWLSLFCAALLSYVSYIYFFERIGNLLQFCCEIKTNINYLDLFKPIFNTINSTINFIRFYPINIFMLLMGLKCKNYVNKNKMIILAIVFFVAGIVNDIIYYLYESQSLSYLSYLTSLQYINLFYLIDLIPISLISSYGYINLIKRDMRAINFSIKIIIILFLVNIIAMIYSAVTNFGDLRDNWLKYLIYFIHITLLTLFLKFSTKRTIKTKNIIIISFLLIPLLYPQFCLNFKNFDIKFDYQTVTPSSFCDYRTLALGIDSRQDLFKINNNKIESNLPFLNLLSYEPYTISYWGLGNPIIHNLYKKCYKKDVEFNNSMGTIDNYSLSKFCQITGTKFLDIYSNNIISQISSFSYDNKKDLYFLNSAIKPIFYLSDNIDFIDKSKHFDIDLLLKNYANNIDTVINLDKEYLKSFEDSRRQRVNSDYFSNKETNFRFYENLQNRKYSQISAYLRKSVNNNSKNELTKLNHETSHLSFACNLAKPQFLVVNLNYSPHWKLKIDSLDAPVFNVNGYMIGCYLDKGAHLVEFDFLNNLYDIFQWPTILGIAIFIFLTYMAIKSYLIKIVKRMAGYKV